MDRLTRARDACVEAVLAGAAVGLVEGIRVGGVAIAAAAALSSIALALVLRAILAVVVHIEPLGRWSRDLRATGASRIGAVWSAVVIAVAVGLFAVVAYRVFAWAHSRFRFHDADAIGTLVVIGYLLLAAVLVVGALALDRRIRPRLPATLLDRPRTAAAAIALGLLLLVAVPSLAIARAVPAFDIGPVTLTLLGLALLLVLRVLRLGRIARWAAVVALLAAVGGTYALVSRPAARLAIVERGAPSKLTLSLVWRLADRDHDGFPGPSVGGADCNDANAAIHPGAPDIPANGVDDNCTGSDAPMRAAVVPAAAPATTKPNIIVISVDALRADRLGADGYARKTPALDTLAASATRFSHAFTSCPSTRCAIPALHTGRIRPRADAPSLASRLRDAGYHTAAITCCERFAIARDELAAFHTLDATADTIRMQRAGQSNGDVVVDRALAWLATPPPAPYFLWVHLYEPHAPYEAPQDPDALGTSDSDRYDREVAFVDAQIGRLLAAAPDAVIVVTADHGEELGEHGIRFHARSLYNQVIRVPLIVRVPGAASRVIDAPVSIVDIAPTLFELAGLPPSAAATDGLSFAPALRGGAFTARPVIVELPHDHQIKRDMAALIEGPWKLIWDRQANAYALYKLDDPADEHEQSSNAAALPALQRRLRELLDQIAN